MVASDCQVSGNALVRRTVAALQALTDAEGPHPCPPLWPMLYEAARRELRGTWPIYFHDDSYEEALTNDYRDIEVADVTAYERLVDGTYADLHPQLRSFTTTDYGGLVNSIGALLDAAPRLRALHLSFADQRGPECDLARAQRLRHLTLDMGEFDFTPPLAGKLPCGTLRSLCLIECGVTDLAPLAEVTHLNDLYVRAAYLNDAGIANLSRFAVLTELNLFACHELTDISPLLHATHSQPPLRLLEVGECPNITKLHMPPANTGFRPTLRRLALISLGIDDAALPVLAKMKQLEVFFHMSCLFATDPRSVLEHCAIIDAAEDYDLFHNALRSELR